MSYSTSKLVVSAAVIAICFFTGCHQFQKFDDQRIPLKENGEPTVPMYRVEMMNSLGGAAVFTGKLDEPTTVQTALEKSGALRRYRWMHIDLYRFVPEKRTVLRMPCELQPGKRAVRIEQDYALMPGDRLVVRGRSLFGKDE